MNGVCPETSILDNADFQRVFNVDLAYQTLLNKIDEANYMKCGRGHNRFSIPSYNVLFPDVRISMPLVRGKKLFIAKQLRELIWFASGMTDVEYLIRHGVHIWDEWVPAGKALYQTYSLERRIALADREGLLNKFTAFAADHPEEHDQETWLDKNGIPRRELIAGQLGPVYGAQWRAVPDTQLIFTGDEKEVERIQVLRNKGYRQIGTCEAGETGYDYVIMKGSIDQLGDALDLLDADPGSARMVVNAWNPQSLPQMALPPCHMMFQFVVGAPYNASLTNAKHVLHMNAYQRSADVPIGVTFNWASYATLLHMVAACSKTDLPAGGLQYNMGDCHIYENQYGAQMTKLHRQLDETINEAFSMQTVADAMADTPHLKINIPDELRARWDGCKYYGTRERFDQLLEAVREMSDEELLKVFEYRYTQYKSYVNFPVSV